VKSLAALKGMAANLAPISNLVARRPNLPRMRDDDVEAIAGKKDQFRKLQERYGMARAQAEKELDTRMHSLHETAAPRTRSSGGAQY
jgi:hypothetical protein